MAKVYTSPKGTTAELVADAVGATLTQGDAVTDPAALTFAAGSIDTGTDMTAAEAAALVADILDIHTQLTALITSLEGAGIIA